MIFIAFGMNCLFKQLLSLQKQCAEISSEHFSKFVYISFNRNLYLMSDFHAPLGGFEHATINYA